MNPTDFIKEEEFTNSVHIVDCDTSPFMQNHAWIVETHQKMGHARLERRQENGEDDLYVDGEKVILYRSEKQKGIVAGHELREELEDVKVLNANILDQLIKDPELYPESWKKDDEGKTLYIFFWGTVYVDFNTEPFVRCLYWRDGEPRWLCKWLNGAWGSTDPAAILNHLPQ